MLFAVLKVFGLAVGNLLGSLSALAKQERMLVINDITSGMRAPSSMMIMMMIMMIMMMMVGKTLNPRRRQRVGRFPCRSRGFIL